MEDRGPRTEGRLDCCEQAQGALCWWQGTCTALKPTGALGTLKLGFSWWSQGSQKGSRPVFPQSFHLWICGLWASWCYMPVTSGTNGFEPGDGHRHRPRANRPCLVRPGFGRPCLGQVQAPFFPVSRLSQSTAIPVVGSPTSDPSSQARLTLQGERNQGVAFRIGRQGPALGSSGPAYLCLPSSLPAASSWLWSGDVAQLSSGQVLQSTWEPQRVITFRKQSL